MHRRTSSSPCRWFNDYKQASDKARPLSSNPKKSEVPTKTMTTVKTENDFPKLRNVSSTRKSFEETKKTTTTMMTNIFTKEEPKRASLFGSKQQASKPPMNADLISDQLSSGTTTTANTEKSGNAFGAQPLKPKTQLNLLDLNEPARRVPN